MVSAEGANGFEVAVEVFDGLASVYRGIGDSLRTAGSLTSMTGATGAGSDELSAALVELGEVATEFLRRSVASNIRDIERIAAVRTGYNLVEQTITTNAESMNYQRPNLVGPFVGSTSRVSGRVDRVPGAERRAQ